MALWRFYQETDEGYRRKLHKHLFELAQKENLQEYFAVLQSQCILQESDNYDMLYDFAETNRFELYIETIEESLEYVIQRGQLDIGYQIIQRV